jgi:hypothetical protein
MCDGCYSCVVRVSGECCYSEQYSIKLAMRCTAAILLNVLWIAIAVMAQSTGQGGTNTPLVTKQIAPEAPDCSNLLFSQVVADSNQPDALINSTSGAQLMYVARGETCDSSMECGSPTSPRRLMTLSIALATSGEGTSQGVCSKIEVEKVPPISQECYQAYRAPAKQLTNRLDTPIYVGVTTTRTFVYYPLQPLGLLNTIAYTYAQFSSNGTQTGCAFPVCSQATLRGIGKPDCDATRIKAKWGDSEDNVNITLHCGALADPPNPIITTDTSSCREACCMSCNSATQNISYRRWPIGPQCQVFRVGAPQLRIYGGLVVSNFEDLSNGEEIRFQTPVETQGLKTTYKGGLQSNSNFYSTKKHVRVHVNQRAQGPSSVEQIKGYVIMCSSTDQTSKYSTCDMGAANPYVQSPEPSPCLSLNYPEISGSIPLVAPPNTQPLGLSTGTVPTKTSLGDRGPCSWYFVPQDRAENVINAPNAKAFKNLPSNQMASALWPNMAAADLGDTTCPGGSTDGYYFVNFTGVPGWELDPETNEPLTTTVCQMSHALNNYSAMYWSYFSVSQDADAAMAEAAPAPVWLMPEYSIARPNWWPHDSGMMYDLGLTYPQRTALELLVQISENAFVTAESLEDLFAIAEPETACTAVVGNGTGHLQLAVQGLYTSSTTTVVTQYLQVNCSTALNGTVQLKLPNGTSVNALNGILPFDTLDSGIVLAYTLFMSFVPQQTYSPNARPFIQCAVQLMNEQQEQYGDLTIIGCRTTLGNASLAINYGEGEDQSGSRLWLWISLGVIGGAVVVLTIVVIIIAVTTSVSKDARDFMAQNTAT